jgi:hypothetical protein
MRRVWYKSVSDKRSQILTQRNVRFDEIDGETPRNDRRLQVHEREGFIFAGYDWGKECPEARLLARAVLRNFTEPETDDIETEVLSNLEKFYKEIILQRSHTEEFQLDSGEINKFLQECGFDTSKLESNKGFPASTAG